MYPNTFRLNVLSRHQVMYEQADVKIKRSLLYRCIIRMHRCIIRMHLLQNMPHLQTNTLRIINFRQSYLSLSCLLRPVRTIFKEKSCNLRSTCVYEGRYIILPVALYGCETWSLTLTEERRLRVFENRMLRRITGP